MNDHGHIGVMAGLSALSSYTDLAASSIPVIALSQGEWKSSKQQTITEYDAPDDVPGMYEIEIWHYQPQRFAVENVADKISLYLSLQHYADERVRMALNDMMKRIAW